MNSITCKICVIATVVFMLFSCAGSEKNYEPSFPLGDFIRPESVNPVISPDSSSVFYCPMAGSEVRWEESDAFNPAAVVKEGIIYLLYLAEDNWTG